MITKNELLALAKRVLGDEDDTRLITEQEKSLRWEAHAMNLKYAISAAAPTEQLAMDCLERVLESLIASGWVP